MAFSTGNRCSIYDKIDDLDEARTVAGLVAQLKPILNEFAYNVIMGDGAAGETHEEWHGEFTDRLYNAARDDHVADVKVAKSAAAATAKSRADRAAVRNLSRPAPVHPPPAKKFTKIQAPPPNRPHSSDLPNSLRAIMDGSHASFREDEGY